MRDRTLGRVVDAKLGSRQLRSQLVKSTAQEGRRYRLLSGSKLLLGRSWIALASTDPGLAVRESSNTIDIPQMRQERGGLSQDDTSNCPIRGRKCLQRLPARP